MVTKKRIIYGLLLGWALLIMGCNLEKTSSQSVPKVYQEAPPIINNKTRSTSQVTNEQMTDFFSKYLMMGEKEILELNQKPKEIDHGYWAAYRAYKAKTNEIMGNYLSSDAKKRLDKQYIQDDFHYPRFLEINDYMIIGISKVENATIISKNPQNHNDVYDVMVTAIVKVIRTAEAGEKYRWDEPLGYYVLNTDLEEGIQEDHAQEDKIKITLNYLVETLASEPFKIHSVQEKSAIYLGMDEQAHAQNNSFISRLPYTDQVENNHREKINQFLDIFMKQEYNFYSYYSKAYNTNYEMVKVVLEKDLGLKGLINLKEDYKSQFNPLIIPLKDDIDRIAFNHKEDIDVKPHMGSSENYPAYKVKINAETTLLDGRIKNYEYIYQFTFENDMILSVRLINQLER